jgi:hypothetical protein
MFLINSAFVGKIFLYRSVYSVITYNMYS